MSNLMSLLSLLAKIEEDDAPICKVLRNSELFEWIASYGRVNRERRKED